MTVPRTPRETLDEMVEAIAADTTRGVFYMLQYGWRGEEQPPPNWCLIGAWAVAALEAHKGIVLTSRYIAEEFRCDEQFVVYAMEAQVRLGNVHRVPVPLTGGPDRFAPWAAWERSGLDDFPRLVLEAQVRAEVASPTLGGE